MQNIYLLGMPSSGKSTLGRALAKQLGYLFLDMDKVIEELEQMTISEIFEQKGEEYFRKLERDVLRTIPPNSRLVVSTGGGAPCFFDNIETIKRNGYSIYVDVSVETLLERMLNAKRNDRPLYQKEDQDLQQKLQQKYQERQPYYRQANLCIAHDNLTVEHLSQVLNNEKGWQKA
jgi:shikimate kinase